MKMKTIMGIFVILHGLVHLWYFVLSQKLVEYRPEMGWTGESWVLKPILKETTVLSLASASFALAALLFVISGIGFLSNAGWWRQLIVVTSVLSSLVLLIFWDGNMQQLVEKGVIGLSINILIIITVLVKSAR